MRALVALALALAAAGCGGEDDHTDAPLTRVVVPVAPPPVRAPIVGTPRAPAGDGGERGEPSCPPDAPFLCAGEGDAAYDCRDRPCAPSCARAGCPGAFLCLDCGAGFGCVPRDRGCE